MKSNITFTHIKDLSLVCAIYNDGTLTICRYGKTKQEAADKVKKRVYEYYHGKEE